MENKHAIICTAYPRAALIGNPSDGYNGKTIAFVFSNYKAQASITGDSKISFIGSPQDSDAYSSLESFDFHVNRHGYYGGIRLLKATLRVFLKYCRERNEQLKSEGFKMSYESNIPIRLGLAGSSAIITAVLKALCSFYEVSIPMETMPNLVLSVEKNELQIMGGLQDRVVQVYSRPVMMSFEKAHMDQYGYGIYEPIEAGLISNTFIAYDQSGAEGSEIVHNNLKERFASGDPMVIEVMQQFVKLTDDFITALRTKNIKAAKQCINDNFDLRRSICAIASKQENLVELIRLSGASAKFTGSGGAVIGMYESEEELSRLRTKISNTGTQLIIPTIVNE